MHLKPPHASQQAVGPLLDREAALKAHASLKRTHSSSSEPLCKKDVSLSIPHEMNLKLPALMLQTHPISRIDRWTFLATSAAVVPFLLLSLLRLLVFLPTSTATRIQAISKLELPKHVALEQFKKG